MGAGPPGALGPADTNGSMVDSKNLDVGDMSDVSRISTYIIYFQYTLSKYLSNALIIWKLKYTDITSNSI